MSNRVLQILASELSDGAKIAAIAAAVAGAKSAREVATITGRKLRTVERHYAELRTSGEYADLRTPSTQICGSSQDKKKGLPHTPSKEKTQPSPQSPPGKLLESPRTVGASTHASTREAEDSKTDRQKESLLAERILKLTASQAERFYQNSVQSWGAEVTNTALLTMQTRQDTGEVFRNPGQIFSLICRDLRDKPKPPEPVGPWGAKSLGNGQFLSRW